MKIYKALLVFISNITFCVLQQTNPNKTLINKEESKTVSQMNNSIAVFDKCCDEGQLFDVIMKRCTLAKTSAKETFKSNEDTFSLGK